MNNAVRFIADLIRASLSYGGKVEKKPAPKGLLQE
jgi:hypothetical protein